MRNGFLLFVFYIEIYGFVCYNVKVRQTYNGRRLALDIRRALFPPERRAVLMITNSELYLLLSLIVSIIALVVNITKKK